MVLFEEKQKETKSSANDGQLRGNWESKEALPQVVASCKTLLRAPAVTRRLNPIASR